MPTSMTKLRLYVGTVFAIAAIVVWQASFAIPDASGPFWNCILAFVALSVLSEVASISNTIGTTSSVVFVPYLAAIILVGHDWAIVVAASTVFVVEVVIRKKPLIKVLHNVSKEIVAIGAAGAAYTALGGRSSLTDFHLAVPAFAAAVVIFFMVNSGAVAAAVALSRGIRFREAWDKIAGGSFLFDLMSSPLALLLAFLYTVSQLVGLSAVIIPLFVIRHVYRLNLQSERANRELLELMVKAIEARDPYTSGHSRRVATYAVALARELGLHAKEMDNVEVAAVLHDVGKIYEEFAPILRKEGRLTPEEFALMKTHPIRSYELVRTISGFRGEVEKSVRHHHENFDGTGYPDSVARESIPLGARIIRIADTIDAMSTDRPYRKALGYDKVRGELMKYSGSQFDPKVVDAFGRSVVLRGLLEGSEDLRHALSEDALLPLRAHHRPSQGALQPS